MPTVESGNVTGAYDPSTCSWLAEEYPEGGEEADVIEAGVAAGHVEAAREYIGNLIVADEETLLEKALAALASVPAPEGVAWENVVNEAAKGTESADMSYIRSMMNGWPDDKRMVRGIMMFAARAIEREDEGDRPSKWSAILAAVRAV